ncbi:hypothetical protein ZIOFF_021136 [Zingiber officinale]|uniref:Uncharacterized protein n=1 Tax=Zingiber officinale TaxID=94328 RepID=A0A8J5H115_ZINOF|nr:hypothetical protein ZIOFF_021136 [Zingiber officinale]
MCDGEMCFGAEEILGKRGRANGSFHTCGVLGFVIALFISERGSSTGQASKTFPGQTSIAFFGQASRAFPSQASRSFLGQASRAFPGQTSRSFPSQASRTPPGHASRLSSQCELCSWLLSISRDLHPTWLTEPLLPFALDPRALLPFSFSLRLRVYPAHRYRSRAAIRRRELLAKAAALEEELKEARRAREHDARAFAAKEAEWEAERREQAEEAGRLRRRLEAAEEAAAAAASGGADDHYFVVEQMREEQARREEAVEKWKQLYLAIKTELDDLIRRTRPVRSLNTTLSVVYWGRLYKQAEEEEGMIEHLQKELKAKEVAIETLTSRAKVMEQEVSKRDREIDILRQIKWGVLGQRLRVLVSGRNPPFCGQRRPATPSAPALFPPVPNESTANVAARVHLAMWFGEEIYSKVAVFAANAGFYRAFKNGDPVAMWLMRAKGDHVYVIHHGAGRISSHDMVMGS